MDSQWTDDDRTTWLTLLRTFSQVNRQLSADMEQHHQMPMAWYDVLIHLYHAPRQGWQMQELAEQVMMSNSGLTRLVDRIIDAGLVERKPCSDDRRVIYITLTPVGRAKIEAIFPQHQARVQAYFLSHLSPEEKSTLTNAFGRILDQFNQKE
jgi:DNA-binding MarR family transcriptional regulator